MSSFHSLDRLSPADRTFFNKHGRGPQVEIPFPFVHQAFEHIVDTHPEATAVRQQDGQTITYGELERRANMLSNDMTRQGLRPGDRVVLVVSRSIAMIVGILAVLKAGAQYVPLDGGIVSEDSLQHIFTDTGARFVFCLRKFRAKVDRHAGQTVQRVVELDTHFAGDRAGDEARPDLHLSPDSGAYVIYTSGTTGKSKGVDVRHRNVTNNLLVEPANLRIRVGTNVAQLLNISFDMAAWEILATLMNGGTLHVRSGDWQAVLKQVDTVISTPTVLGRFAQADYPNLRTVVVGGEPCPVALAEEWAPHTRFWNICGPTEITILNTAHLHRPGIPLTIGAPLPNTSVYVLDDDEEPVDIGEPGVMWAGGACVSAGYVNLPELTATRYKLDKFANDGSVMFNTGDLVRWTADGKLEPLGRKDDQVKIKGFRVELDGVGAAIESVDGVTKACALVLGDELTGFYAGAARVAEAELLGVVGRILPYYAVPGRWIYLDAGIPCTANGKFDKRALRALAQEKEKEKKQQQSEDTRPPTAETTASTASTVAVVPSSSSEDVATPSSSSSQLEKGEPTTMADDDDDCVDVDVDAHPMPAKKGFHGQRWLRYTFFSLYRRFFSVVFAANLAALIGLAWGHRGERGLPIPDLATAVAANLLLAVAVRLDYVVNFLFWLATRVPVWAPLAVRRQCAKVYHIGGLHSGAATSATLWWLVFTGAATADLAAAAPAPAYGVGGAVVGLSYAVLALLLAIVATAHPALRARRHDQFEQTHRLAGWAATALVWAHLVATAAALRAPSEPLARALARTPAVYLLALATLCIALPWLRVRRVRVRPEPLSGHAIRLHFDFALPGPGKAVRLATRPLRDWHAFATVGDYIPDPMVEPTPPSAADDPSAAPPPPHPRKQIGFSVVVSNAGDWTRRAIGDAPRELWTRGAPASGVLTIAPLFRGVVLVATGSGIGPCLAVLEHGRVPARVLWTTPGPAVPNFGAGIVDAVRKADPAAVIWDTRGPRGKPNLAALAYAMLRQTPGMEAVCIISNARVTRQVVYRLEARGVPAYGAIFDS
ncbi:surfactin synthetase subunit 3 [Xylariomycetidae sp. FL0641]|nr:surfactin synthetase subunit 3 [Xylariomycetidae sp. FL0641]